MKVSDEWKEVAKYKNKMIRKRVKCWCGKTFYFNLPVMDFKYEDKKYKIKRASFSGESVKYDTVDIIVCSTKCATRARLKGYKVFNYDIALKNL